MIKKHYVVDYYTREGYFGNYLMNRTGEKSVREELAEYKATLAKSKRNRMNVKWHDPKLYTMFVLRWS